jgi:hypothetical protein
VTFRNDVVDDIKVNDHVVVLGKESTSEFMIGLGNTIHELDILANETIKCKFK